MKQFIAGKNEHDVRLSRFVVNVTQNLPTSLLYKYFRNKRIKVNGKKALPDARIKQGDIIELYINDEFFYSSEKGNEKALENTQYPPLDVLYEDENILAVFKPVNLLCHSDKTGKISLVDIIRNYLKLKGEYKKENEHTFSPSICNRLDTNTQGIVIAAKNYAALRDMNLIIKENLLKKIYKCITVKVPNEGIFKAYLKKDENKNKVSIKGTKTVGYKEIITGVKVVKYQNELCLCDIELITGRTHQIRAHLAYLGAPILGDSKYSNTSSAKKYNIAAQMLCAYSVEFSKDITEENILHYLKGKKIVLQNCSTETEFERLTSK